MVGEKGGDKGERWSDGRCVLSAEISEVAPSSGLKGRGSSASDVCSTRCNAPLGSGPVDSRRVAEKRSSGEGLARMEDSEAFWPSRGAADAEAEAETVFPMGDALCSSGGSESESDAGARLVLNTPQA